MRVQLYMDKLARQQALAFQTHVNVTVNLLKHIFTFTVKELVNFGKPVGGPWPNLSTHVPDILKGS